MSSDKMRFDTVAPASLSFRLARAQDAGPLTRLINTAYLAEVSDTAWTSERAYIAIQRIGEADVAALISTPGTVFMLAFNNDALVGCANLVNHQQYAYFGMFAVTPALQSAGIGRQVLAACEAWIAREWGLSCLKMKVVNHRHELIAWYKRRGYSETNERLPFAPDNVPLNPNRPPDTEFIVLSKAVTEKGIKLDYDKENRLKPWGTYK